MNSRDIRAPELADHPLEPSLPAQRAWPRKRTTRKSP